MTVSLDLLTCMKIIVVSVPLAVLGAGLLTVVASFTKSFREAQSYLSMAISLPTLPLAFIGVLRLEPTAPLIATPSLGQHLLGGRPALPAGIDSWLSEGVTPLRD